MSIFYSIRGIITTKSKGKVQGSRDFKPFPVGRSNTGFSSRKQVRVTCTSHFYIVKLGLTGVNIFFLFLLQNIDCGYSLEPPH